MSLRVVFRPKVGRDLAAGFRYYEGRTEGLGERFLAAIDSTFDAIESYPQMFAQVHGAVRRALVTGFPYAVFYRMEINRLVVLTVLHTARDPKVWPQPRKTAG
jgi:plasmid stabilization system protein ParE